MRWYNIINVWKFIAPLDPLPQHLLQLCFFSRKKGKRPHAQIFVKKQKQKQKCLRGGESSSSCSSVHGGARELGAKMGAERAVVGFGEGKSLSKSWGIRRPEILIRVAWINFLTYLKCLREKWGLIYSSGPFFFPL